MSHRVPVWVILIRGYLLRPIEEISPKDRSVVAPETPNREPRPVDDQHPGQRIRRAAVVRVHQPASRKSVGRDFRTSAAHLLLFLRCLYRTAVAVNYGGAAGAGKH